MQWDGFHWTSVSFWRHCNCLIDEGIYVTILPVHLLSLLSCHFSFLVVSFNLLTTVCLLGFYPSGMCCFSVWESVLQNLLNCVSEMFKPSFYYIHAIWPFLNSNIVRFLSGCFVFSSEGDYYCHSVSTCWVIHDFPKSHIGNISRC
jgi:hypothetical protein